MNTYHYDIHIHSCLSPCADDDMTPCDIAGMGAINGLNIMALTDHNSTGNCRSFEKACHAYGIVSIPGMELTTAEDIHVICLFPTVEVAESFGAFVQEHRILIPNKPEIFGEQYYKDENDVITHSEPYLLPNATTLSLEEGVAKVLTLGGVAYPAHIDREANGIIAILGDLPQIPDFTCVEYRDADNIESYTKKYDLQNKQVVVCSDAHHLWDIAEGGSAVELDDEPYSSQRVRMQFLKYIGGLS